MDAVTGVADEIYWEDIAVKQTTESKVKDALREARIQFVYNKQLENAKFRPDFMISNRDVFYIIEIDQNQHKSYKKCEESTRALEMHHWAGQFITQIRERRNVGVKIVMIRFNPDDSSVGDLKVPTIPFADKMNHLIRFVKTYKPSQSIELHFHFFDLDMCGKLQVPWLDEPLCEELKSIAQALNTPLEKISLPSEPIADMKRRKDITRDTKWKRAPGNITYVRDINTRRIRSLRIGYKDQFNLERKTSISVRFLKKQLDPRKYLLQMALNHRLDADYARQRIEELFSVID